MNNYVQLGVLKMRDWGYGYLKLERNPRTKRLEDVEIHGVATETAHDLRIVQPTNADPNRWSENLIACEETGWELKNFDKALFAKIGADQVNFIERKAKAEMEKLGVVDTKHESSKVVSLLLSVSPEWLRDGTAVGPLDHERARKWLEVSAQFLREWFGTLLLCTFAHNDELNPHLGAFMVPLVFKVRSKRGRKPRSPNPRSKAPEPTWGLDAKSLFTPDKRKREQTAADDPMEKCTGGETLTDPKRSKNGQKGGRSTKAPRIPLSGTCSILQSAYADYCRKKELDVRRGLVGSDAQHEVIARFNRALRRQVLTEAELNQISDVEDLRKHALSYRLKAEVHDRIDRELRRLQDREAAAQQPLLDANAALRNELTALRKKLTELEEKQKRDAEEPYVGTLITKLTGVQPRTENCDEVYVLQDGRRFVVDQLSNRFGAWNPNTPDGERPRKSRMGAIEAAMILTGCSYMEATRLVAEAFGSKAAEVALSREIALDLDSEDRITLEALARQNLNKTILPDDSQWPTVRDHLVHNFHLDSKLLDELKQRDCLAANAHGHLLTYQSNQNSKGRMEMTGTIVQGVFDPAHGFWFETGGGGILILDQGHPTNECIAVEDPLEALALHTLSSWENMRRKILVLGRSRSKKAEDHLRRLAAQAKIRPTGARSEKGRSFLRWFDTFLPKSEKLALPPNHKSWLDLVQTTGSSPPKQPSEGHTRGKANEPARSRQEDDLEIN